MNAVVSVDAVQSPAVALVYQLDQARDRWIISTQVSQILSSMLDVNPYSGNGAKLNILK